MENKIKSPLVGGRITDFRIEPLELEDIDTIATIFFASFTDAFVQRMFPETSDTRKWWYRTNLNAFLNDPTVHFMKAVDPAADHGQGKMIAWAKWVLPAHKVSSIALEDKLEDRWPGWPTDGEPGLCDIFFGHLEQQRKSLMQDRPHYFLEMIGTLPEYQGRGVGSALIRWALDQADSDGLETYLDGSPGAIKTYERLGFEGKVRVPMPDDSGENYVETFMVRVPRSMVN